MMHIEPRILIGNLVQLEPLQFQHAADLLQSGQALETWNYMPANPCLSPETMQLFIAEAQHLQQLGECLPFAIIDRTSGAAIGSTRYLAISAAHYGLEIGWTWVAPQVRRSGVNTECKYLLLRHAFEEVAAMRVELKTDSRNLRSQRAIERIGGVREGVLRNHMLMPDGYRRDSVYYSILDVEWPQVKAQLEEKMQAY